MINHAAVKHNEAWVRVNGSGNVTPLEGASESHQLIEPPPQGKPATTRTTEVWVEGEWTQMPHVRLFRVHRKRIWCVGVIICIFTYIQFLSYEEVSTQNTTPDSEYHYNKKKSCNSMLEHQPIDVVYTWVNGSEKQFQDDIRFYSALYDRAKVPEESYSPERFSDKEELKYSLRSLEKHMSWIRHVYIVTNGQIPSWLDLDYDKVTIVTHEEIFPDGEFLPTFSSPAIEANLHRIPGLSQKFIYFNDDVFLNADVFPEDFYTQSKGYKIYTAWNVNNCANNCDWHKLNNSQCDIPCYKKECDWDYRDCDDQVLDMYSKHLRNSSLSSNPFTVPSPKPKQFYFSTSAKETKTLPPAIEHFNFVSNLTSDSQSHSPFDLEEKIKLYNEQKIKESKLNRLLSRYVGGLYGIPPRRDQMRRFGNPNGTEANNTLRHKFTRKDLYSASLMHTQKLLSKRFGFSARPVIAHAPIMIDKQIMKSLQEEFPQEFDQTMKHKFRQEDILQISFLYSHYLSSKEVEKSMEQIFHEYDTDQSGTWSDREIHTLLTRVAKLPLAYETVTEFQNLLINCSSLLSKEEMSWEIKRHPIRVQYERYVDSSLNLVTKKMIVNCPSLTAKLRKFPVSKLTVHKHEFVNSYNDVSFNMLVSQPVIVMDLLNNIRKAERKFICINDDLDRSKAANADNDLLITILHDFFLSLFPKPSKFELPAAYRNRFARVEHLRHWRRWRWSDASLKSLEFAFVVVSILCAIFLVWQLAWQSCRGYNKRPSSSSSGFIRFFKLEH